MTKLDRVEREIIRLLQLDGRMSFVDMADRIGVTEGTIRRKFYRLIKDSVVRIVGVADPFEIGFSTAAVIGINVEPGLVEQVARQAAGLERIHNVALTTGNYDVILQGYFVSNEELSRFILEKLAPIQGVREINTSLILRIDKTSFEWGVPL